MPSKPKVLVDVHYRRMASVFSPADLQKLYDLADVVWGKDEKMPYDDAREAFKDAVAVIGTDWRYGDALQHAKNLRGYISVGGNLPQDFDYETAFAHNIRVLSCAPAFGPQVAEFALGLALACRPRHLHRRQGDEVGQRDLLREQGHVRALRQAGRASSATAASRAA